MGLAVLQDVAVATAEVLGHSRRHGNERHACRRDRGGKSGDRLFTHDIISIAALGRLLPVTERYNEVEGRRLRKIAKAKRANRTGPRQLAA
jgi:hypothetical protein